MPKTLPDGFPSHKSQQPIKILTVCLGNICRSPTSDGILRYLVKQRGFNHITVDSCGTAGYHVGEQPDERSTKHAAKRGYDLSVLRARKLSTKDFDEFDIFLCADDSNVSNVKKVCPDAKYFKKIYKLTDFLPENSKFKGTTEVPDPYYGGEQGFEHVLDLCEDACTHIMDLIQQQ